MDGALGNLFFGGDPLDIGSRSIFNDRFNSYLDEPYVILYVCNKHVTKNLGNHW